MYTDCFMVRIAQKVLGFIAAMLVYAAPCLGIADTPGFREYISEGDYFKCSIPGGWNEYRTGFGLSGEQKNIYGLTLSGPPSQSGVPPEISIYYYAPGNLLHNTMDMFVKRHSAPVSNTQSEGIEYSAARKILIAGRQAKTFDRRDVRFTEDQGMNQEKVLIYEEFIVVPAKNGEGFYVLRFSLPCELREIHAGTFAAVVKSFVPVR